MDTHTAQRTPRNLVDWYGNAIAALAAWTQRISNRIGASRPSQRHRMGAWEENASLYPRQLRVAADREAA